MCISTHIHTLIHSHINTTTTTTTIHPPTSSQITPIGQLTSLHLFDADITATLQMFSLAMTLAVTLISMARLSSPVGSTARAFSFCYVTTWACLRVAPDYVLGARYHLSSPGGQYFLLEQVCILGAVLIGVMMLMLSRVSLLLHRHHYTICTCVHAYIVQ